MLRNPLILTAGILGTTFSSLNRCYAAGFGAVTTKSIGIEPREGYANPSVIYIPEIDSIINAVGLANPGYITYGQELKKIDSEVKYIMSIFGSTPDEFQLIIKYIQSRNLVNPPKAFELNLSCPHATKGGISVGTDPEIVYEIVKGATSVSRIPIWIKLTPNITDIKSIADAGVRGGATGIVAINTVKAMLIDITTKKPILANIRGGLSGRAIKPIGIHAIYDLYEYLGAKTPLIGTGGIWNWQDIIEYILAGATAVGMGSLLFNYNNLELSVNKLITGIKKYLETQDMSISEIRGLAHEHAQI